MWDIPFIIRLIAITLFALFSLMNMMGFIQSSLNAQPQSRPIYHMAAFVMFTLSAQSILSFTYLLPFEIWKGYDEGKSYEKVVMLADMVIVPGLNVLMRRLSHASRSGIIEMAYHMFVPILFFVIYSISRNDYVFYAAMLFYTIYSTVAYFSIQSSIRIYETALRNTYSDIQGKSIQWTVPFVHVLLMELALWTITRPYFTTSVAAWTLYYLVSICLWWWMSHKLQEQVLETSELDTSLNVSDLSNYEMETQSQDIKKRIEDLFERSRTYMQPNLSISQLALELGLLRNDLAAWFHQNGTSFNEDVANKRLEVVAQKLVTSKDDAFIIAAMCGFSHKDAFENDFHQKFGCTTNEYRRIYASKSMQRWSQETGE